MSISAATLISSPTDFAPVTVKLLSCTPLRHVAGDADAFPDEKQPDGEHFQLEVGPAPKRHVPAMPRGPIDEE